MRMRAFAMAVVAALAAAACGSSGGHDSEPGGSDRRKSVREVKFDACHARSANDRDRQPSIRPLFQGPTGHEWTGKFNHDPYNDQGFEDATAYAVAQQLGFTKDQVKWVAVPFNNSYKPGPKNFDFYLAQVSYTPQRAEGADLSDSYYDEQEAVVALQGTDIAKATSVAGAQAVHVRGPDRHDQL